MYGFQSSVGTAMKWPTRWPTERGSEGEGDRGWFSQGPELIQIFGFSSSVQAIRMALQTLSTDTFKSQGSLDGFKITEQIFSITPSLFSSLFRKKKIKKRKKRRGTSSFGLDCWIVKAREDGTSFYSV